MPCCSIFSASMQYVSSFSKIHKNQIFQSLNITTGCLKKPDIHSPKDCIISVFITNPLSSLIHIPGVPETMSVYMLDYLLVNGHFFWDTLYSRFHKNLTDLKITTLVKEPVSIICSKNNILKSNSLISLYRLT